MKNLIKKVIISILVAVMTFSVVGATISFSKDNSMNAFASSSANGKKTSIWHKTYLDIMAEFGVDQYFAEYLKDETTKNLKNTKSYSKEIGSITATVIDVIQDPNNVNWKNKGIDVLKQVVSIAGTCIPYASLVTSVLGPILDVFKDKEPSEIQLLQEHIDEKFEEVNEGIADVRYEMALMSNSLDESFDDVVKQLKEAIEAQSAGEKVYAFSSSGEGNFDYTVFKNYIYGLDEVSNDLSTYAYYDKIVKANLRGDSDEQIEEYYNNLYNALMTVGDERIPYINILRQYILQDEFGYSIQRYYYDFLSGNRELIGGANPEWEAVKFALDLYQTLIYAESLILLCDNYFEVKLIEDLGREPNDNDVYKYGSTNIRYRDLKAERERFGDEKRDEEIAKQIISDIIYILNASNSYVIENQGSFYVVDNCEDGNFGMVRPGQKIYMNNLSGDLCEAFDVDPQDFAYVWSDKTINSGEYYVDDGDSVITATLTYKGQPLYTTEFKVNNNSFSGGNGKEETPYLIAYADQFSLIETGASSKGVYYRLVKDVTFNATRNPIGTKDEPFEGVFDGNGYCLKNLSIRSTNYTGLFGKLGKNAEIKNLVLSNFKLDNSNLLNEKGGTDAIYAGAIAGYSEGKITNCRVENSTVELQRDTNSYNVDENIETHVGGIAGYLAGSNAKIKGCAILNSVVGGYSKRNYTNRDNNKGQNNMCIGGIVGQACSKSTISDCAVLGRSKVKGEVYTNKKPTYFIWQTNDTNIYINLYVGGIAGKITGATARNLHVSNETTKEAIAKNPEDEGANGNIHIYKENVVASNKNVSNSALNGVDYYSVSRMPSISSSDGYNHVYSYGEDYLNLEKAVFDANGQKIEDYYVVSTYGFDTNKSDKIDGESYKVTALLCAEINGYTEIFTYKPTVKVEPIKREELVIEQLPKVNYDTAEDVTVSDIVLDGGKFVIVWEDGSTEEVTPNVVSVNKTDSGKTVVELEARGFKATYSITVKCEHNYVKTVFEPTCTSVGCTKFTCSKCADYYVDENSIIDILPHNIVIEDEKASTCLEEGYTGNKRCVGCDKILEYGKTVEKLPHEYYALNGNSCKCKVCEDDSSTKEHEFTTVENDSCIIYTCITCGYSYTVDKIDFSDISRVVVGNSYGIVGKQDDIAVYVKIFNNPGIAGVSFRIEYDPRLEYVGYERGNLLLSASEYEVAQVSGVIGFVAASADVYEKDGNLLKLIFRLPEGATLDDKYDIVIACTRKQFVDQTAREIGIVTMHGSIRPVSHLPGDVNNDDVVDLLDTALVARYVAVSNTLDATLKEEFLQSQNYNFNAFYADVNLDRAVDVGDLVIMLQYFVGKNVQELVANEFELILNPNNGSSEVDRIIISAYDDEGNPAKYPELPTPEKESGKYRFDGWYLTLEVKDLEKERIAEGYDVIYNPTYSKQTLYAHWTEIYTVNYNVNSQSYPNASEVSGEMESSTFAYGDDTTLAPLGFKIKGWTFQGWAIEPNGDPKYGDAADTGKIGKAGDVIELYAIWEQNVYTVDFKNNPPTSSDSVVGYMNSQSCKYDKEYPLNTSNLSLKGWTFKGWALTKDGDVIFNDGEIVKNLTNNDAIKKLKGNDNLADENNVTIELFAVWVRNTYTFRFNFNKPDKETSVVMEDMVCDYDTAYTLPENKFEITGWTFDGWSTSKASKDGELDNGAYIENYTPVNGKVIDLYAVWKAKTYTIVYNANKPNEAKGVTGTTSKQKCTYDEQFSLNQNGYSIQGWEFLGWSRQKGGLKEYDGEQTIADNQLYEEDGRVELYAIWRSYTYTVSFDKNEPTNAVSSVIGEMPNITVNYDEAIDLSCGYSLDGWQFIGWTKADGTPVGESFNNNLRLCQDDGGSIILFAKWTSGSYTINYLKSGNSLSCGCIISGDEQSVPYACDDEEIFIASNTFTVVGHKFVGWAETPSGAVKYYAGETVKTFTNTTKNLYAVWAEIEYDVVFNENGGSGAMANIHLKYHESKVLTSNAFSKTGYHFIGWNTKADGTGTSYYNGQIVNSLTTFDGDKVILYAQWDNNVYEVVYHPNGGTGSMANSDHIYDVISYLNKCTFTRTGYHFTGWWNTKADGSGDSYRDCAAVNNLTPVQNGEVTLYAQWDNNVYDVVYHPNGGTGSMVNSDHIYDVTSYLNKCTFTRTGYHFTGWNTKADGTGTTYGNEATVKNLTSVENGVFDLYAQWEADVYEITLNSSKEQLQSTPQLSTTKISVAYDSTSSINCIPTAIGYAFSGWQTATGVKLTDANGKICVSSETGFISNGKWSLTNNQTLYASWIRTTPNSEIVTTTFSTSIYAEGSYIGTASFSVTGVKVKYNGIYYIYGNAYYSGVLGTLRFNDVDSIYFKDSNKAVLMGGVLHWRSSYDDNNESGVAGWDKSYGFNAKNICYRVEDPGKDFAADRETITISITDICVALGGSANNLDGVPEIVTSNLTTDIYCESSCIARISFDLIGIKVQYNGQYYLYGSAFYNKNPNGSRFNDVHGFSFKSSDKNILLGGTLYWSASINDNNESGIAGYNKNYGFNSKSIDYMVEDPGKDFSGGEVNIISIAGICVQIGGSSNGDTVTPTVKTTTFTTPIRCESSTVTSVVKFNVTGFEVNYNGVKVLYGNAFYSGNLGGSRFNDVANIYLGNTSKNVYLGGTIHWYGTQSDNNESGVAGYYKENSNTNTISYLIEDPRNDFTGNEGTEISITGICVAMN